MEFGYAPLQRWLVQQNVTNIPGAGRGFPYTRAMAEARKTAPEGKLAGFWRRRPHGPASQAVRRLWPHGLASRVALILMVCLFVVQAFSLIFYVRDRAHATVKVFALSVAERIVAIVELLETAPPAEQPGLLRAINSPTLWLRQSDAPYPESTETWRQKERIRLEVRRYLRGLGDRPVRVEVIGRWRDRWRPGEVAADPAGADLEVPDLLPSRQKIAISVGRPDGGWTIFTVSSDITSLSWAARMAFWIVLTGGFILVFAIWAARRVTKPLTRFAEAADRLGVDVRAPPLPETGSRELRRATRAFNRMQERLRRFVDDRTLMLAAISHDLRTALTRLRLRSEFIEDAEQQRKALGDLDEMQAMLDATLSFARDDTVAEPRSKVDLAALLQSLCDDLADAGQRVQYQGPDRLTLACRPLALRRAFANLIGNAVKYGGAAEVSLAAHGELVEVEIADRGPGIAEALREKVFTPFFRVEPSRSRETGGTGLGLAVARSVLRRHGGDVVLEDRPGGGLVARVSLPVDT